MKIQPKPKLAHRLRRRDGITIIEVLTSLLVATIGVFGVLILIPFAVQQAQIGLDQDAADLLATNALEDLQIYGYTIVDNNGNLNIQLGGTTVNVNSPSAFHFDPLSFTVATPVNSLTDNVPGFTVNSATGLVAGGALMSNAEANRIFRSHDDIVIGEKNFFLPGDMASEIDLPQPVFDVDDAGNTVRRQSRNRISWSAIFVPFKDTTRVKATSAAAPTPATKYTVYVLVYKDRDLSVASPASLVTRYMSGATSTTANGGHVTAVDQIFVTDPTLFDTITGPPKSTLGKDDWVMLINRKPVPAYTSPVQGLGLTSASYGSPAVRQDAEEPGFNVQLDFAKVISVDREATPSRMTVSGGDFNFYFSDVPNTETYVVNLRNVVNVYERTISLERNSSWLAN